MLEKKIVLGSGSPRRKELIEALGIPFRVLIKSIDETIPEHMNHYKVAEFLAKQKSIPLVQELKLDEILITSDTVVLHQGKILGKPSGAEEAHQMILGLSNSIHEVVTGVFLTNRVKSSCFSVTTKVHFRSLSEEEISHYISNFQPFDKAGGYGIQEWIGKIGVSKIDGCFYNVMGLPLSHVWEALKQF
jgi:septum formation protein